MSQLPFVEPTRFENDFPTHPQPPVKFRLHLRAGEWLVVQFPGCITVAGPYGQWFEADDERTRIVCRFAKTATAKRRAA